MRDPRKHHNRCDKKSYAATIFWHFERPRKIEKNPEKFRNFEKSRFFEKIARKIKFRAPVSDDFGPRNQSDVPCHDFHFFGDFSCFPTTFFARSAVNYSTRKKCPPQQRENEFFAVPATPVSQPPADQPPLKSQKTVFSRGLCSKRDFRPVFSNRFTSHRTGRKAPP